MKTKKLLLPLLTIMLFSCGKQQKKFFFDNSDVSARSRINHIDNLEFQQRVDVVENKCDGETYEETISITFPEQKNECDWGQNGNLSKKNEYARARLEELKTFDLPGESVICDMEISSQEDVFKYDDHIFLMLNNSILFGSYPNYVAEMEIEGTDIPQYSWNILREAYFNNSDFERFCLGQDLGSFCTMPQTQQTGQLEVYVVPQKIKEIMALNLGQQTQEVMFVTTGDNDSKTDCKHSEFTIDIKMNIAE